MRLIGFLLAVSAWAQVATDTQFAATPANAFMLVSMNTGYGTIPISGTGALNLALSPDGIHWSAPVYMNKTTFCNTGGDIGYCARDPGIGQFGNNGWIPYTCAFMNGGGNDVAQWCMVKIDLAACYASVSTCSFSAISFVSTSALSMTLRDWRPHWVVNADNTVYKDSITGCPSISFTSTDGTSVFRAAEMHPTGTCTNSTDFGAAAWSTPVLETQMDSNMIDPFKVWDGTTFTLFYVWLNLVSSANQSIQYGTSSTLTGTYTKQTTGFNWTGFQNGNEINQEGPALLCLTFSGSFPSGSCTKWRMYFDQVGAAVGNIILGQINYSETTSGFGSGWSPYGPISTSTQAKNGMVIPYP